jgi:hypothetical protein|tara:strand:+ start:1057 stop:1542 length:486 start_codon:yes stop_codon:yes gene_type:complete
MLIVDGYKYSELQQILCENPFIDEWVFNHGYPQSKDYHDDNTEHYSLYGIAPPTIEEFANKTFSDWSVAILEQRPGMVIPLHLDTYYKFKEKHGIKNEEVVRYNIFLDDWQPGHYMEADSKPIVNWKAGNYVRLNSDIWHRTANVGTAWKYTCQITGVERG